MEDDKDREALAARVAALERAVADLELRLRQTSPVPPEVPSSAPSASGSHLTNSSSIGEATSRSVDIESLIAGRWLNRIGVLAVALGLSYFLKLAIDNEWIGPRTQVALGIVLGASLLASVPWFLRRGYRHFADSIAGLGAASLYLSLWAGSSYYGLFPPGAAFAFMIAVTTGMLAIALVMESERVALFALVGGFLTPALAGSGRETQTVLFTYLALLNASLLPIAWSRDWRWLDLPALLATHLYFWAWYSAFYSPDQLWSTLLFVFVFCGMFLSVPVTRAQRSGIVTGAHTVLVPANAGFTMLAFATLLWAEHRWTLTLLTLALAGVHLAASRLVPVREGRADVRLLLGGVACTLATLAIPIRLDGAWVTLAFAIQGALLIWSGFHIGVLSMRRLGFVLCLVAGLSVVSMPAGRNGDVWVVLNARFIAEVVTIACFAVALWTASGHRPAFGSLEPVLFAALGVAITVLVIWSLTGEVRLYFRPPADGGSPGNSLAEGLSISVLWACCAAALMVAGIGRQVASLRWQGLGLFGLTIVKVFVSDISFLSGIYRVASSVALGVVLLVVSFLYQRGVKAAESERLC
jgi:uncharacterized membrane protein